jgi:hypothetical protein
MVIKYIHTCQSKALQKIYPNWDFWFENKPSGNPARDRKSFTGISTQAGLYLKKI